MNPKPLLITGLVLAVAGIAVGLLGLGVFSGDRGASKSAAVLKPDPGWEGIRFPDFSLVDQDGKPVDQSILDGKVTIVDFIFTSCPLQCPAMTGSLWALSEDLKDTSVHYLSMSIDPARDTPDRLRQYATEYHADPARWRFLTGPEGVVRHIVRDALMFEVSDNPESKVTLPDGSTMDNIVHPPHYILVGPDRQVLGIYWYQDAEQIARLKDRAQKISASLR